MTPIFRRLAAGALAFGLSGCPDPAPISATPTTREGPTVTTAPPKRAPGLDPATREALKKEYRALALKNDCSRGFKNLDGTWRFAGESKTPEYSSVTTITGTKYHEVAKGKPDGEYLEATLDGEIRCLFKNRVLIQIDKVVPEGAYDNKSGDSFPCDLLGDLNNSGNKMMMICYFDWDVRTAAGWEFEYERVK